MLDDRDAECPYLAPLKTSYADHVHHPVLREVLLIKSRRVRVDFYDNGKQYLERRIAGGQRDHRGQAGALCRRGGQDTF